MSLYLSFSFLSLSLPLSLFNSSTLSPSFSLSLRTLSLFQCHIFRLRELDDIKATIASLHASLNVDEYKLRREQKLVKRLESAEIELKPLQEVRDAERERREREERERRYVVEA